MLKKNNTEKLLYIIGEADDRFIPDIPEKKRINVKTAVLTAAAALLIGTAAIMAADELKRDDINIYVTEPLPDLSAQPPELSPEDRIYPEYDIDDIDGEGTAEIGAEILSSEQILRTYGEPPVFSLEGFSELPVFEDGSIPKNETVKSAGLYIGLSGDEMEQMAEKAALAIGARIESGSVTSVRDILTDGGEGLPAYFDAEFYSPAYYDAVCVRGDKRVNIRVRGDGRTDMVCTDGIPALYDSGVMLTGQGNAAASEFAACYSALLQYPLGAVSDSYSYMGGAYDEHTVLRVYEASGDRLRMLINRALVTAEFVTDDEGRVCSITLKNRLCCCECVGKYEVLSAEKAKDTLCASDIFRESVSGEAEIIYGGISYLDESGEKYLLPYHVFYAELSESGENGLFPQGLKSCAVFFVPAVETLQ